MTGPAGKGCGGVSVTAELLEEHVTGAVLDALESPRVQQAVRAGQDTSAPRRAELLEEIRKAQDKRAEARRDWADDTIDKADWLDIKQRTDARIARARREYDTLTGPAAVFGDIPASDMVRDARDGWYEQNRAEVVGGSSTQDCAGAKEKMGSLAQGAGEVNSISSVFQREPAT